MSFNRFAQRYDQLAHLQRAVAARLAAQVTPTGLGIDLGSGTGFVGQSLPEGQWIEVDRSPDMLACSVHTDRVVADAQALPFADESFDWGVSSLAMQWMRDAQDFLRVLRRGARYQVAIVVAGSLPQLHRARQVAGVSSGVALRDAEFWRHQLPGDHRLETLDVHFDSPRQTLASVRDIGASGAPGPSLSRQQHRHLLEALGCTLSYQILWIQGERT